MYKLRRNLLKAGSGLATFAATRYSVAQSQSISDLVVELDKRLNGFIRAHDVVSASAIYDEEFMLTVAGGGIKRKAHMLADIANPAVALTVCETTDIVVLVRANVAVLTGTLRQAGKVDARAFDVTLRVTDTWVNVDGKWLLLAGHASR
jgi:ketosteroid isomerase-like protein